LGKKKNSLVRTHARRGEIYADFSFKRGRFRIKASVPTEAVKEVDFEEKGWQTVFQRHPYRLRYNPYNDSYILIIKDKHVVCVSEESFRRCLDSLYRCWTAHHKAIKGHGTNLSSLRKRGLDRYMKVGLENFPNTRRAT